MSTKTEIRLRRAAERLNRHSIDGPATPEFYKDLRVFSECFDDAFLAAVLKLRRRRLPARARPARETKDRR